MRIFGLILGGYAAGGTLLTIIGVVFFNRTIEYYIRYGCLISLGDVINVRSSEEILKRADSNNQSREEQKTRQNLSVV